MILELALLLAATPQRVVALDETVQAPAKGWRAFDISLQQRPAVIECRFAVVEGSAGVRLAVMPRDDVERFCAGLSHRVLFATGYERSGAFRTGWLGTGDYSVVVDNRLEGRRPAGVRVAITLLFPGTTAEPRLLSPGRRAAVIATSLLCFCAIALYAGWRLRGALFGRSGQPPPASTHGTAQGGG